MLIIIAQRQSINAWYESGKCNKLQAAAVSLSDWRYYDHTKEEDNLLWAGQGNLFAGIQIIPKLYYSSGLLEYAVSRSSDHWRRIVAYYFLQNFSCLCTTGDTYSLKQCFINMSLLFGWWREELSPSPSSARPLTVLRLSTTVLVTMLVDQPHGFTLAVISKGAWYPISSTLLWRMKDWSINRPNPQSSATA